MGFFRYILSIQNLLVLLEINVYFVSEGQGGNRMLEIKGVTKRYKSQLVLDDITYTFDEAGIWALVGPNGIGKTTLLNCITNILNTDKGTVTVGGLSNENPAIFKKLSYLQDNNVLFDELTGYDHLAYIRDVHKLPKKRVQEVADYVGMSSYLKKKVGNYSLGMKQHLLLAMAILPEPKVILLDEPLNGLDPSSAILMRKILLELAAKGTIILLSSHNLAEVDKVTQNILFLKGGKLHEVDTGEHERTIYSFKLSDTVKGKQLVESYGETVWMEEDVLKVETKPRHVAPILSLLHQENIVVEDISKETTGTEALYEELFHKSEVRV